MGFLSNSVAVTRFNVAVPPGGPDFERARFWEIEPGSEVRERMGFVPFELDAPWEVAQGRYVFRLRIDRIRPDATAVKERLREVTLTGAVLNDLYRFLEDGADSTWPMRFEALSYRISGLKLEPSRLWTMELDARLEVVLGEVFDSLDSRYTALMAEPKAA